MIANQIGKILLLGVGLGLLSNHTCAQIGSWRTYYNYRQSYGLVEYEGSIYSRATHSLLRYELESQSINSLTAVHGLHNAQLSSLSVVEDLLVIGYVDGRIDVLKEDELSQLVQLQRNTLQLPRTVRTSFSSSDKLYVGGDFGLLVFEKSSFKLRESYLELGSRGEQIAVYEGQILDDSLFLATEEGLIHAAAEEEVELLDFRNWKRPDSGAERKQQLKSWKGKLYSLSTQQSETLLLRYETDRWQTVATLSGLYSFLRVSHKGLLIGQAKSVLLYEGTDLLQTFSLPTDQVSQIQDVAYVGETLWISDALEGLGRVERQEVSWLRLPSPKVALPYALQAVRNQVYVFHRGLTFPEVLAFPGGLSVFEKGKWHHPKLGKEPVADVVDALEIEGVTYLATYENGVWQKASTGWQPLPAPTEALAEAAARTTALAHSGTHVLVATHSNPKQPLLSYDLSQGWETVSQPSLPEGSFSKLVTQSKAKQIWGLLQHGHSETLLVFSAKGESLNSVSTGVDFSPRKIYDFVVDTRDRLWIASSSGLFLLPQTNLALQPPLTVLSPVRLRIQREVVLNKIAIYGLTVDGAGRLWCATETGIWLVDTENDLISRRLTSENSPLPTTKSRALAMTDEGELFIGTDIGLLSYRTRSSKPKPDYTQVRVFPNPVRSDFTGEVAISYLPLGSIVRITTLSGQIVRALQTQGGTATWDTRDQRNRLVSSGVYIIHSVQKDGDSRYAGKIAVIR